MEQSKFIRILEANGIKYEIEGNVISVLGNKVEHVNLRSIKSLPENVHFNNGGYVILSSLEYIPKTTQFNNGGFIDLDSLEESSLEYTQFNNGGYIYLNGVVSKPTESYIKRHNIKIKDEKVILYKRVSKDFLTQERKFWVTLWEIGRTLTHPEWEPEKSECGPGKFHACAKPFWCDWFRHKKDDRYIAIEIKVEYLHEWKKDPCFPQKISFRCGKVLYECDRYGNKI